MQVFIPGNEMLGTVKNPRWPTASTAGAAQTAPSPRMEDREAFAESQKRKIALDLRKTDLEGKATPLELPSSVGAQPLSTNFSAPSFSAYADPRPPPCPVGINNTSGCGSYDTPASIGKQPSSTRLTGPSYTCSKRSETPNPNWQPGPEGSLQWHGDPEGLGYSSVKRQVLSRWPNSLGHTLVKRPELCPVAAQPSNVRPGHSLVHPSQSVGGTSSRRTCFASTHFSLPKAKKTTRQPLRPSTPTFMRRTRQVPKTVAALNMALLQEQEERERQMRSTWHENDRNKSLGWWLAKNGKPQGFVPPSVIGGH